MKRSVLTISVMLGLLAVVLLSPSNQQVQLLASSEDGETCDVPGALAKMFDIASPAARAQGEEGANSICDDYQTVCADVGYRAMIYCDFWGLGDCFCKGRRAYNKCMNDVGCPGVSAEAMMRDGCSCINRSCLP